MGRHEEMIMKNNSIQLGVGLASTDHQDFPSPVNTITDHFPRRETEIPSTSTQQCCGNSEPFCNASDQFQEEPDKIQLKGDDDDTVVKISSSVTYKECLRNHAASIGGYAVDGCGEFMPPPCSGNKLDEEAFKCSACGCHRNFHKKEIDRGKDVVKCIPLLSNAPHANNNHPHSRTASGSDHTGDRLGMGGEKKKGMMKKRFRTKFTQEQKEKMLRFAERAEWRMQKLDESEVQRFCQECGIKRRVLKVWMHNNKLNYAKKIDF